MDETDELRAEFQPLMIFFMSKLYEHWEYMLSKQHYFRDPKAKDWFQSIFANWRDQTSFLYHFCSVSLREPEGFGSEQLQQFFSALSRKWNGPLANFEASISSITAKVNQVIQQSKFE